MKEGVRGRRGEGGARGAGEEAGLVVCVGKQASKSN